MTRKPTSNFRTSLPTVQTRCDSDLCKLSGMGNSSPQWGLIENARGLLENDKFNTVTTLDFEDMFLLFAISQALHTATPTMPLDAFEAFSCREVRSRPSNSTAVGAYNASIFLRLVQSFTVRAVYDPVTHSLSGISITWFNTGPIMGALSISRPARWRLCQYQLYDLAVAVMVLGAAWANA